MVLPGGVWRIRYLQLRVFEKLFNEFVPSVGLKDCQ